MHRPVPGIDAQLQRQEAAGHLRPEGERGGVEQPVRAERAVPDQGREGRDREIGEGRKRRPESPQAQRREGAPGQHELGENEAREKRERDLMVETEHRVLHFLRGRLRPAREGAETPPAGSLCRSSMKGAGDGNMPRAEVYCVNCDGDLGDHLFLPEASSVRNWDQMLAWG